MADLTTPAEPGCSSCTTALTDPDHGIYMLQCSGCRLRMMSFGQEAWLALQSPTRDAEPLRRSLLAAFGEDHYLEARRRLWAWVQLRAQCAGAAPPTA
jgi:hypothetical protein